MKVLWLCNMMLPVIAGHMGQEGTNKEGWVSGMAEAVLADQSGNGIVLSVAFPMQSMPEGAEGACCLGRISQEGMAAFDYYGFLEDVRNPEKYDEGLEQILKNIVDRVKPDIVHCFGTEYPHTLAMCRIFPRKDRLLLGLQGLCTLYAEAYFADLPKKVVGSVTFRDWLKRDSIRQQKEKFTCRGRMEREAVALAGNVTGRTQWDKAGAYAWNPEAKYHFMNESLRREFYGPVWQKEKTVPHSIFLSQGDYPLKGLHYMLLALPKILKVYPDVKVYVAGNSIVEYGTWKQKLKISAYGKYLRRLISQNCLEGKVVFLGKLDAGQMRDRYLQSSLFVCCSAMENSPNSLGEAMLLGMPCVSGAVGGIASIFRGGEDGILYEGAPAEENESQAAAEGCGPDSAEESRGAGRGKNSKGGKRPEGNGGPKGAKGRLEAVAGNLAAAVLGMWQDPQKAGEYCRNARSHALETHDREKNYRRLVEIYEEIL